MRATSGPARTQNDAARLGRLDSTVHLVGDGTFPAAERARLGEIVRIAHVAGQRVHFWATPTRRERPAARCGGELVAAGVDYLNTDDPAGLAAFLRAYPGH